MTDAAPGKKIGGVNDLIEANDGTIVATSHRGIFVLEDNGARNISSTRLSYFRNLFDAGNGTVLLGSFFGGLLLLDLQSSEIKHLESVPISTFYTFFKARDGAVFISTGSSLHRMGLDGSLSDLSQELGAWSAILDGGQGVGLLLGEKGAFLADQRGLRSVRAANAGRIAGFLADDVQGHLIGSAKGLFRLEGSGQLTRIANEIGAVRGVFRGPNSSKLIHAENGLFRLGKTGNVVDLTGAWGSDQAPLLKEILGERPTGGFRETISFHTINDGVTLIGSQSGLFRLGRAKKPVFLSNQSFRTENIVDAGNGAAFFIDNDYNLTFVRKNGDLVRVEGASNRPAQLLSTRDKRIFVGTESGVFNFVSRANLQATKVQSESYQALRFKFVPDQDCIPYAKGGDFFLVNEMGETIETESVNYGSGGLRMDLVSPPVSGETQSLKLMATDAWGASYEVSTPFVVSPPMSWSDLFKLYASVFGVVHTLFFGGLVFLSGKSDRAAGLLLSPIFSSLGLWWSVLITYSPSLQRWLLSRWFTTVKDKLSSVDLLPLNLSSGEKQIMMSNSLWEMLGKDQRIWLQGKPGMGKSLLVESIEADFFLKHSSLREAYSATGYIPLVITLRSMADPGDGDRFFFARLAEKALSGAGLLLDENSGDRNTKLVEAFLRRAGFVLLLDGANEVTWLDEIENATAVTSAPGLLVTSQGLPSNSQLFECWQLPDRLADAVDPLLRMYLGDREGAKVYDAVASTPLFEEINSGFDVRLIETLHNDGVASLPEGRLGLYEALVSRLCDGVDGIADRLYALAWTMWTENRRQFDCVDLDSSLRQAILGDALGVSRQIEGEKRELRHDQMRGYLAAMHLARVANPLGFLEEKEAEWPKTVSEQDLVWQFAAQILDQATILRVYQWSLQSPENRIRLQMALMAANPGLAA